MERSRASTNEEAYAGYLNAWVKENFVEETKGLDTATLVCIGEHDGAFTKAAMEGTYLAWLPIITNPKDCLQPMRDRAAEAEC